jgi:hypothetical protein
MAPQEDQLGWGCGEGGGCEDTASFQDGCGAF